MKNYRLQSFRACCETCKFSIVFTGDPDEWHCDIDKKIIKNYKTAVDPNGICDLFEFDIEHADEIS